MGAPKKAAKKAVASSKTTGSKSSTSHKLSFSFNTGAYESASADALIIGVFSEPKKEGDKKSDKSDSKKTFLWTPELKALDKALAGMLASASAEEKFDGTSGKSISFRKSPSYKITPRRVVLVGLGDKDKLTCKGLDSAIQKGIGIVSGIDNMAHIAIVLPPRNLAKLPFDASVQTAVDATYQTVYYSDEALADTKKKKQALKKVSFLLLSAATAEDKKALHIGEVMAYARAQTKDLVNKPPNIKCTDTLANIAKFLAKKSNISVSIQSDVKWIEKNMPCFFAVARGSVKSDPPKFIHIIYKPKGGKAKKKIALVGKSVIFDTGGYQVKTGNYMNTMKGDMTGGAVMLSTMGAIADLQPEHLEIHAFMAATPNKIDTDAFLPDSIYPSTCGKFVEIRHTDAEGRLTLIDAVAKANEQKPDELVVMATLTGSASQAVGMSIALMGNNDDLVQRVEAAANRHDEPIQSLKVTEDDYSNIKSKLDGADLINTNSGKGRGAQTAAAFVMSGAPESLPIAHMDIAGADMTNDEKATGIGQKTVIQYLLTENANLSSSSGKSKRSK